MIGSVTLPGVRPSVGRARRFARELLPCAGPWLDDLVTVVSETVCNAITHTRSGGDGGRVTVTVLACAGGYRLEVADDGAGGDRSRVEPETGTERGRGMRIVEALAVRWGYRERGERTVVWAEFAAGDASVCTPGAAWPRGDPPPDALPAAPPRG